MYHGERFNAYSHLAGALLAGAGLVLLIMKAVQDFDPYKLAGAVTYGVCLLLLYAGSTLYHSIPQPKAKTVLQKVDHCMIYLLIAGSYTPFTLVTLKGGWGWSLFGVSWGLALVGIVQELTIGLRSETRRLSLLIYVVMGWLILVALYPLAKTLSAAGLFWLALGGLLYSVGIYWFVNDEKIKHGHGIWHLFVLGGSLAQFVCIYFYVI
ncbi:PAQR family membrane homeostasis protein TrhA [Neisseria animalis]|uniref:Hemolysin III family protein n=1 Tax=Neisseria animalis TaxID=492 RepID=A0A5P3MTV9_NEIAN|nr:hemolysin III family protein [Neisseria animalis]QEY24930.1 hemolysin III family protein [Neisseria animalis]ROW33317.1 hemolysin III family protein [Neisseria animalis]VEE09011.1 Hemolysin, putative [Neisseria animalis]